MSKGIIYVCSTAVDGLIKIGKTNDFERRMTFLESNGYRNVAGLKRQFAIEVDNFDEIEVLLDDLFAKSKVGNTELFSLDINKVIQLLSAFQGQQIYPEIETKKEVFERTTDVVQTKLLPNGEYHLNINQKNGNVIKAKLVVENGVLILKKDSMILNISDKAGKYLTRLASTVKTKNNRLIEDTIMSSVSLAAGVVMGINWNGWFAWKDNQGRVIDIYRKKNIIDE